MASVNSGKFNARAITELAASLGIRRTGAYAFVAYATDLQSVRYAVLDTGRELTAVPDFRTSIAVGRNVRATAREVEREKGTRRQLSWRLASDERAQERGR